MIQQYQTESEQVPITAIYTMNDSDPLVTYSDTAQTDNPQVRQANCNHQITQALRIGQVIFVQKAPPVFLVREEGFDLKSLFIPIDCFIWQAKIGHQIEGMGKTTFPLSNDLDRAIAFFCKPNLWNVNLVIPLEEQVSERKLTSLFIEDHNLGRAADRALVLDLQSCVQGNLMNSPSLSNTVRLFGGRIACNWANKSR